MDQSLLETLNGLVAAPGVRQFAWLVHQPWAPLLLAVVYLGDIARRKRWVELAPLAVAAIVTDAVCARVLKASFERVRPCATLDWVVAPFGCGSGFSMPSCHAATAFALAMVVNRPWAFALALLIALSRSVAGVHYPSDLMAGAAVGIVIGWVFRWLTINLESKKKKRAR